MGGLHLHYKIGLIFYHSHIEFRLNYRENITFVVYQAQMGYVENPGKTQKLFWGLLMYLKNYSVSFSSDFWFGARLGSKNYFDVYSCGCTTFIFYSSFKYDFWFWLNFVVIFDFFWVLKDYFWDQSKAKNCYWVPSKILKLVLRE